MEFTKELFSVYVDKDKHKRSLIEVFCYDEKLYYRMAYAGKVSYRLYLFLERNKRIIRSIVEAWGLERYSEENLRKCKIKKAYKVVYEEDKLMLPGTEENIDSFIGELYRLTKEKKIRWEKRKAHKQVQFYTLPNELLPETVWIHCGDNLTLSVYPMKSYSQLPMEKLYNLVIRQHFAKSFAREIEKAENESADKLTVQDIRNIREEYVKKKHRNVCEIMEEYRQEEKYSEDYLKRVWNAIVFLGSDAEARNIGKIIAYCTIKTFNAKTQEIVLMESGQYIKIHDDFFGWDISGTLGSKCVDALLKEETSFKYGTYTYEILDSLFLDKVYEQTHKKKSVDARIKTKVPRQYNLSNLKQVYVFYKLNNSCSTKNHDVESVTMKATDFITNREVEVNAYYCKTCNFYFINYEALKGYIERKIIPQFKYRIVGNSIFEMNAVSELMLYGYNVKEGVLTEWERHCILESLIDSGIMTRYEIIRNIESKIDFNGRKKGNEEAKRKWQEDIQHICRYTKGNEREIVGVPYRPI